MALGAILAVALALRLPGFGESLWHDEAVLSDAMLGEPISRWNLLYSDIHPPGYFLFQALWNAAFGDSEISLRLPPLLCGLATIALVARLGALVGGGTVGLVAAWLMALAPVHIWYSQEARPYSASLLLLLVATLLFYRLQAESCPRRWAALYFAVAVCLVFTHYYMVLHVALLGGLGLLRRGAGRRRVVLSTAVALALFSAYFLVKAWLSHIDAGRPYLRALSAAESWRLLFVWFPTGGALPPSPSAWSAVLAAVQVLVAAAFAAGAARALRPRPRPGAGGASFGAIPGWHVFAFLLVVPAFLAGLALARRTNTYIERSALSALPFFAVLIARGIVGSRPLATRIAMAAAAAIQIAVLVLFFARWQAGEWTVYKANPDWRGLAEVLDVDALDPTQPPRHLYTSEPTILALTYYEPRIQPAKVFEPNRDKLEAVQRTVRRTLGEDSALGAWLLRLAAARFDELAAHRAEQQRQTRIAAFELASHPSPREHVQASGAPAVFYLLGWDREGSGSALQRALQQPGITRIASVRRRSLQLHVMQVAP